MSFVEYDCRCCLLHSNLYSQFSQMCVCVLFVIFALLFRGRRDCNCGDGKLCRCKKGIQGIIQLFLCSFIWSHTICCSQLFCWLAAPLCHFTFFICGYFRVSHIADSAPNLFSLNGLPEIFSVIRNKGNKWWRRTAQRKHSPHNLPSGNASGRTNWWNLCPLPSL